MLKKTTTLSAEIDCSWQKQFKVSCNLYNGYSYDLTIGKSSPIFVLYFYTNLTAARLYLAPKIYGTKLNMFSQVNSRKD